MVKIGVKTVILKYIWTYFLHNHISFVLTDPRY